MHCPYCTSPLREDSPSCPRCGLTMEKASAFFGAAPLLARGVTDTAGVLEPGDVRRLRRSITAFERRFPQTGFTVAFMALPADTPGPTYTFWAFNRCNPAGEMHQGSANRHLMLLVDTAGKGAWMTVGYGLEPFIGDRHLRQCLEKGQPLFSAGQFAAGTVAVVHELTLVFREVIAALPRTFGLDPADLGSRSSASEPQPAAAW